jgi:integrase
LKLAREYAAKRLREARQGLDVREPKEEPAKEAKRSFDNSTKIEQVIREFTKAHLEKRTSAGYLRESESRFRRFVLPAWKGRDVRTITRKDVRELVQGIEREGRPYPANRTLSLLSSMFTWCIENDRLDENQRNPAQGVRKPGVERVRDKVLSDVELALVWHAAGAVPAPWGPWARLLLLTGQRRSEVAGMRWENVDLAEGTWTLRARQTKSRRAHVVTLSALALDVLAVMPHKCPWAFTTDTAGPISNYSFGKGLLDGWLSARVEHVEPWHIHDIRRTVATGLAKLEIPPHVIASILNHAPQGVTAQVYNRYSYVKEKREALDKWAQHVAAVAERYRPAPTERELHQQAMLAAVRTAYNERLKEALAEGDAASVALLTGGKSMEEAKALLRDRQANG